MRLGESIWICKRTSEEGAEVITYADPVQYKLRWGYLTLQPTTVALNNMSGFYTTEEYGEHTGNGWNMIANYDAFDGVINPGDLVYCDGNNPDTTKANGYGANAFITSVREQYKIIFYTLNKIEGA